MNCQYHPLYRNCVQCGREMERGQERVCSFTAEPSERTKALREARELIKSHAVMTWKSGQIAASDGITGVLVDFDLKFPEGRE